MFLFCFDVCYATWTLMCFLSHTFVALAVCFGSLSCWNTHPRPIFNALASFMPWSIVPLRRCSCPVPIAEKHPQSIMFPPPCLTVGMCSWAHRQHSSSKHSESMPKSWILVSSDHNTFTQFSSESLAHFRHMCFLERGAAGFQSFSAVCYQLSSW